MVATADEIHAVFLVARNAGHVPVRPIFRQLLPPFDDGIADLR
jgi:hypothetical protein